MIPKQKRFKRKSDEYYNDCAFPKKIPKRLNGKKYSKFRKRVHDAAGGLCYDCGKPISLDRGHVAHIKSKGSGGGDTIDNCLWKCFDCHIGKEHGTKFNWLK